MVVGIAGTGNVGATLGRRLAAVGHRVVYGARDPQAAKVIDLLATHPGEANACALGELAGRCELLLLAIPYAAVEDTLAVLGDLTGKVLIDATNPLLPDLSGLSPANTDSAGERIARLEPGARLVKAFNTIGVSVMANPHFPHGDAFLPVAGEDAAAKELVIGLARELGFDARDAGPLSAARWTEALAMFWIHLAIRGGWGGDFAFEVLSR